MSEALTDEQRHEIALALPKVGEPENVWTTIRASTLRAIAAQSEQVDQWIPVTERLPSEVDGTVAVRCIGGDVLTAWASYWHGASNAFNCWSFPHGDDDVSAVTHWTPLPRLQATGEEHE